jgi:colanic acid/amylovoran biosynthesis glycosyltransferase
MNAAGPRQSGRIPVVIYRDHLLRFSEIWVRSQGEALGQFIAHYAGSKRRGDVPMPEERTYTVSDGGIAGRAAEGLFKVADWAPGLRRWIRGIRPALIHAHYGVDGALVAPIARAFSLPLVVTFHGYEATMRDAFAARSFYLHRKYLRRRAALARDGALFIAVSNCVRNALIDQGFPAQRTVTHYIGVDAGRFMPDPAVPRENVVLFVGRFDALKGAAHVVRAMAEVGRRVPDATLVLIGDGPERANLESLAARNLRNCRFLGFQPQDAIKTWLNRARVLCVPSLTIDTGECEAFGLVFLEAQAMGVPVASYASGGIPEAVAHGTTGLLAPEGDCAGLAAAIAELLDNRDLWQRMSAAGMARARREFDLARQTRALEQLYRTTLERHRVRQGCGKATYPNGATLQGVSVRGGAQHRS